jgi:hypothetical protein
MAKSSTPNTYLKAVVMVPTVTVILAAIWISGMSMIENIRLAHATDQIVKLVVMTHDIASTDKNFALRPSEDVLGELAHAGLLNEVTDQSPASLLNPWKGQLTALITLPSAMRIESVLPARDCRRLAQFFIRNGADLGLSSMEARESTDKIWHQIYGRAQPASSQPVEMACGQGTGTTLAVVFLLRG